MFAHLSLAILAMFFISAGCSDLSPEISPSLEMKSFSEVPAWQKAGTLPDSSNTKPMASIGLEYQLTEKAEGLYEITISNQSAFTVTGYALLAETKPGGRSPSEELARLYSPAKTESVMGFRVDELPERFILEVEYQTVETVRKQTFSIPITRPGAKSLKTCESGPCYTDAPVSND